MLTKELGLKLNEELVLRSVQFSKAKGALSGLMTQVVHQHRPELIERHGGREAAVLMSREDLLSVLGEYRFRPQITLDQGEATAALGDLGVLGFGSSFEEAMEDLVRELRRYARRVLVERPSFYLRTDRASHFPWLLRFALTPPEEQLELLYEDS